MRTLEELWPLFGLRVFCGPLEMRVVRDGDLPQVLSVVQDGIHHPERTPFLNPWTDNIGNTLVHKTLQHYWRNRAEATPEKWSLELGVWREDTFVGIQEISTEDFSFTHTGETGSWRGLRFQGRGTGTLMRQAMCALCFDHLGFTEITSAAFTDNPQSLAVSAKVGYLPNGLFRHKRRDAPAVERQLLLTPEAFVRAEHPVVVEGAAGVRRFLGIEVDDADSA